MTSHNSDQNIANKYGLACVRMTVVGEDLIEIVMPCSGGSYLENRPTRNHNILSCLIVGRGHFAIFEIFTPIAFYNNPPFYQIVKVRLTPHFITNPAILGFSKFLRKQKSFSARQNSFWELKLKYIFTNCMFTEKKQNFFNSKLEHKIQICHHTINCTAGSSVVNLCVKANIHLWPSILFPPPPPKLRIYL